MPDSDLGFGSDDEVSELDWAGETAMPPSQEGATFINAEVTIPEGCVEGDVFEVVLDGVLFEVTVPKGKKAQDLLQLEVPAEAMGKEDPPEVQLELEPQDDAKDHRHVTFADAAPAVVLFRPEVGGLHAPGQLTSDELRRCEKVELIVPTNCRPGDILNVNRGSSEMEITVPQGCQPGDILEVNLPPEHPEALEEGEDGLEGEAEELPRSPEVLALQDGLPESGSGASAERITTEAPVPVEDKGREVQEVIAEATTAESEQAEAGRAQDKPEESKCDAQAEPVATENTHHASEAPACLEEERPVDGLEVPEPVPIVQPEQGKDQAEAELDAEDRQEKPTQESADQAGTVQEVVAEAAAQPADAQPPAEDQELLWQLVPSPSPEQEEEEPEAAVTPETDPAPSPELGRAEALSARVAELEARNSQLQETVSSLEREKKFLSSSLTASLTTSFAKSQVYLGKHRAKEEAKKRRRAEKQAVVQTEPWDPAWGASQAPGSISRAQSQDCGQMPPLPHLPPTLPKEPSEDLEDWEKDGASIATLKMAVLSLKQEKEDLRQKLAATQKEKIRLELQERNSVQLEAYAQAVLSLKTENAELREIALQVLRGKDVNEQKTKVEAPKISIKTSNKISTQRQTPAEAASKWLAAPSPSTRPKRHKVLAEDVDLEDADARHTLPAGHAGGLRGVRGRSQSDGCIRVSAKLRATRCQRNEPARIPQQPNEDVVPLRATNGIEVLASPCGSSKACVVAGDPPASAPNPLMLSEPTAFSTMAWSSWRQRDRQQWHGEKEQSIQATSVTTEGRLATAAIYAGAAMNANMQGWGATAKAAEAAARQKYSTETKKFSASPESPLPQTQDSSAFDMGLIAPLAADGVPPAQVNERSASGALVLEPGQAPQLRCADHVAGNSPSHADSMLAADDTQLCSFFTGGAYLDGKDLAACCPPFRLVDDSSYSHRGDGVPIFRHTFTGALLLGHPIFLCQPGTPREEMQLLFRRGPLPTVRHFAQGLLGCAELLHELISGSKDDGMSPRDQGDGGLLALCHGPRSMGETGGSESDGSCYMPMVVCSRSCSTCPACSTGKAAFDSDSTSSSIHSFVTLPDVEIAAGFAFEAIEWRLQKELHNSDREGQAVRRLGHFLSCMGRTEEAAELWQRALNDEASNTDSLQTGHSAAALATCLDDLGRAAEAERFHSKALAAFEKALGRGSAEAAAAQLALTTCRYVQGMGKKHGIAPSAGDTLLRLEGASAHALAAVFSKAVSAEKEEDWHTSLCSYRQALGVLRRTLGPHHPDTLHCLNNLALCLGDQGKLHQAEQLLRRTLAGMEVVLSPGHPRPIQAQSNLAYCLAEQGKLAEAERHHRRAFEACKRKLGWKHPETATSAQSLAQFLMLHGRSTEAALLELQAQQFGTRLLSPKG